MRRLLLLLLLTGCSDARPGFDLLDRGLPVALEVVYRSPTDPWPEDAPRAGQPSTTRPLSLRLMPGPPVPRRLGPHWMSGYAFDAPQARAVLELLSSELSFGAPTPPPPLKPSYLLRIGIYRDGRFEPRYAVDLGEPETAALVLRAVATRLNGPVLADLQAFLDGKQR